MPPQSTTRTPALTPMRLLTWCARRAPAASPVGAGGSRRALDEHGELVQAAWALDLELVVRGERRRG